MASADFWLFSYPSLDSLSSVLDLSVRPPQVRSSLSLHLSASFTKYNLWQKGFFLFSKLIQLYLALYEVRVPQTGGLPLAP